MSLIEILKYNRTTKLQNRNFNQNNRYCKKLFQMYADSRFFVFHIFYTFAHLFKGNSVGPVRQGLTRIPDPPAGGSGLERMGFKEYVY
jgi:hypothetical protein